MKRIKIVHTGDIHFDTPFKEVTGLQRKINKEELKEVFKKIIHFCKGNSVDILLLAGDIFDNFTLNRDTLRFIENTLGELTTTKVFISPGNHDPYEENSFYKVVQWPKNVHIFKGGLEKVYIEELDANIWGAAFEETYVRESILKGFNGDSKSINIMVLHGEISNSKIGNEYNPITIDEIGNSGMDYIALGHRHGYSGINKYKGTYYAYCGCPQGRGFDEIGDKGIIYGYVSKGVVELDFVKTSIRNYLEKRVNIEGTYGYEEIKSRILASINEDDRKNNFYKIFIEGEISEDLNLDEEVLREKLSKDFYFCKVRDNTLYKYNLEEISKGYSIKGIFAKKLMKELESAATDEEKEIIMMALKYGISSLSEGEVKINDN